MLELHHQTIWKTSQNNRFNNIIDSQPISNNKNNVDEIYQCYLPQIIETFNILPIDISSYNKYDINFMDQDPATLHNNNPRPHSTNLKFGYPKLRLHRKKTRNYNRKNNQHTIKSPKRSKHSNEHRRRQFEKHMRQKKQAAQIKKNKHKNNEKAITNEQSEPKMLLNFLRVKSTNDEFSCMFNLINNFIY